MSATVPQRHPRRVLVADDSRSMRMLLGRTLKEGAFDVRMVEDGHALRESLKQADAPLLVVSDWQMPGPSGVEICRDLRSQPGGDRFFFLVVTANTDQDSLLAALESGANDFIRKPFSPAELLARVNAGQRVIELQASLEAKVAELAATLSEVRTLRGLIPICMHCHSVRTVGDHWQKLEAYLEEHSEAVMSHGLCEACLEKFYPEPPESEVA
jgi:sigma-B regulation protein RsbU (phosphoserine phosphatase)